MNTPNRMIVPTAEPYLMLLRDHRQILRDRYHVSWIGLFGSRIRGDQHDASDLDVLVAFDETPGLFTIVALQDELSMVLGVPVDIALRSSLKPYLREAILREVVEV